MTKGRTTKHDGGAPRAGSAARATLLRPRHRHHTFWRRLSRVPLEGPRFFVRMTCRDAMLVPWTSEGWPATHVFAYTAKFVGGRTKSGHDTGTGVAPFSSRFALLPRCSACAGTPRSGSADP